MRALLRYAAGHVFDLLRARVTPGDFARENVERVLLTPALDAATLAALRRMFPRAELRAVTPRTGLRPARAWRADVAAIAMSGAGNRERLLGLLSGARHKVLVPSADYLYRLGLRGSCPALLWAMIDRFAAAPFALIWLALTGLWLWCSGLMRRIDDAEHLADGPRRVLLIRLVPAQTLLGLLRRIRERWPGARVFIIHSAYEDETAIAAAADRVIRTSGLSPRALVSLTRRLRPDLAMLAGGDDYGLGPTYWKAVTLARLSGARRRHQWAVEDELPGRPLGEAVRAALGAAARRAWSRTGGRSWEFLARPWRQREYRRPPRRGPRLVQIGITEACNYHCLMCPFHNPVADETHCESELPRMSYGQVAKLLAELRRLGTKAIDLCGSGEPLTHAEAMDIIALIREMGFELSLATNAALLTEERARRLVDLGLRRVHVSIDAGSGETYARMHPGTVPGRFSKIIERLRAMADYADSVSRRRIDVEFSAVLTRLNMREIVAMVEAAHRAQANSFMLIQMGPVRGQEELVPKPEDWPAIREDLRKARELAERLGIKHNLDQLEQSATPAGTKTIYQSVPCYIGHEFALVLGRGAVLFCCHCLRPLGDAAKEGFGQVWKSETYREARRMAMALPVTKQSLPACGCFHACPHVSANLAVHRRLHGDRPPRPLE